MVAPLVPEAAQTVARAALKVTGLPEAPPVALFGQRARHQA
jgi:hypothetical protein